MDLKSFVTSRIPLPCYASIMFLEHICVTIFCANICCFVTSQLTSIATTMQMISFLEIHLHRPRHDISKRVPLKRHEIIAQFDLFCDLPIWELLVTYKTYFIPTRLRFYLFISIYQCSSKITIILWKCIFRHVWLIRSAAFLIPLINICLIHSFLLFTYTYIKMYIARAYIIFCKIPHCCKTQKKN